MFTGRRCGGHGDDILARRAGCGPRSASRSRPASATSVVLPQPEGPSSAKNSPCADIERERLNRRNRAEPLGDGLEAHQRLFSIAAGTCAACAAVRHRIPVSRAVHASGARERTQPGARAVARALGQSARVSVRWTASLPAGILALPHFEIHARLEAPIELPLRGKTSSRSGQMPAARPAR